MKKMEPGDPAPDFSVTSHDGQEIRLSDYRGRKVVVLFFYPKDGTPVCTKEACAFRDAYEDFVEAGAVVIGVSSDSSESHRKFASNNRLPFILVSDKGGSLRRDFRVAKTIGFLPGRATYVIDRDGITRLVFNAQMTADRHVEEALTVVRELKSD